MYFASRVQAGRMLAGQLLPKYRYENCAVVALNDGGVVIGAQIAMQLHCAVHLLMTKEIILPRENEAIATMAQDGSFTYNSDFSPGEIEEMTSEYYGYLEQEKMTTMQSLHRMDKDKSTIRKDLLKGHYVILVSDGLKSGHSLDVAMQYLKPINTEGTVIATPLASVKAVDYMHVMADDLYCLSVVSDYMDTDHYYDTNDIPPHTKVIEIIERVIYNWK